MPNPDTPLGRGCKLTAILACISGLFVAALLIVGWIWLTGLKTFGGV